ncbi:MAG: sialate O-acetylesterase [Pseudomonadota bacterium]
MITLIRVSCFWIVFMLVSDQAAVPAQAPIKVYILAGQSNMYGVGGSPADLPPGLRNWMDTMKEGQAGCVLFYYRDGLNATLTHHVETHVLLNPNSGHSYGPELSFARSLSDYHREQIAVIKYAWGAVQLAMGDNSFYPGDWDGSAFAHEGTRFADMLDTIDNGLDDLKSRGYIPEIKGFVWMQGESDSLAPVWAQSYGHNLEKLIRRIRRTYGLLPFVYGQIHRSYIGDQDLFYHVDTVRQGQTWVLDHVTMVGMLDTASNISFWPKPLSDKEPTYCRIHFNGPGLLTLGQEFAAIMKRFVPAR